MIAIVDYGMGNLRSVERAISAVGGKALITQEPSELRRADGIIVPGVGAFAQAMGNLEAMGMKEEILAASLEGKLILGICLGFQLLFSEGLEGGRTPGLGLIPGRVMRFSPEALGCLRVPHIGWNQIKLLRPCPLLGGVPDASFMYFAHSFRAYPENEEVTVAITDYGGDFPSVVAHGNVYGLQFHPEKSGRLGLGILRNFVALAGSLEERG